MSSRTSKKMNVLIVGGGIGGLMLGIMLERAGIDYQVLERSAEHRPLGSAITLNGTVLRVFEQLGLLEELYQISKFAGRLHLVREDLETQGHVDLEHFRERYGYNSVVFGRPDLFKVLVSHIPPSKLLMGKRILSTAQTEDGVMVRCADGSIFHGDILVGADGAYSSVRTCMHKTLKDKGLLPKSDSEHLKFDQHCVVGITDALDPEKFPALKEEFCELYGVIGKRRPYTIWLIPITGNRFAWSIGGRVPESEAGQEDVRSFSFAQWWPEQASDVCDLVRDYTMPDFRVRNPLEQKCKDVNLTAHDLHQDGPPFNDDCLSDVSSVRSGVLSESSPVSSSASSAMTDDHTLHPYSRNHSHTHAHSHTHVHAHPQNHNHPDITTTPILKSKSTQHTTSSATCAPTATTLVGQTLAPPSSKGPASLNDKGDEAHGYTPKRAPRATRPGTVAEIIDATNADRISKVMLESKMFKVWHHERTVLIGDACHKVLPFAGQGAIQAILDGISLANALYDMNSSSMEDITKAFKRYTNERIPVARAAVIGSRSWGKLLNVQGRLTDFIRKISFTHVPHWALRMATDKLHLNRPQLGYLPIIPDRGSARAHKQDYSPKYLARLVQQNHEQEMRRQRQHLRASIAGSELSDAVSSSSSASATAVETDTIAVPLPIPPKSPSRSVASSIHRESYLDGREREHHHHHHHHYHHVHDGHRHGHARHYPRSHTAPILFPHSPENGSPRKRPELPPPLPALAPPRHHPSVYIHPHPNTHHHHHGEDKMMSAFSSRASSAQSSPSSSSYSLTSTSTATAAAAEEIGLHYYPTSSSLPRTRRHTHSTAHHGRSLPSSPKNDIPPPPPLGRTTHFMTHPLPLEAYQQYAALRSGSAIHGHVHGQAGPRASHASTPSFSPAQSPPQSPPRSPPQSPPRSPPRSPLSTSSISADAVAAAIAAADQLALMNMDDTPIAAQFRNRIHKRTQSLQLEDNNESLALEIMALEQTTALMKERVALREQRSWDHLNSSWQKERQQHQEDVLHHHHEKQRQNRQKKQDGLAQKQELENGNEDQKEEQDNESPEEGQERRQSVEFNEKALLHAKDILLQHRQHSVHHNHHPNHHQASPSQYQYQYHQKQPLHPLMDEPEPLQRPQLQ